MRQAPSAIASVPVLHALELVVTWLPSARSPTTRAEMPLAITCSTAVLPRRATFFGVDERHDALGDRVHAADAGAEDRAGVPVDAIVVGRGPREAGVAARPRARPAPRSDGSRSSRASSSSRKAACASASTPCGTPATWQAKPARPSRAGTARPAPPFAQRAARSRPRRSRSARSRRARSRPRAASSRHPHAGERRRSRRACRPRASSPPRTRSLAPPEEHELAPRCAPASPGRTMPENSTSRR